jgi:hypothetical protein
LAAAGADDRRHCRQLSVYTLKFILINAATAK